VICYDDASTDNSVQLLSGYARDPRFRLLRGLVNRGTLYARIRLIEAARSPRLAFLDPDDEFAGAGLAEALDVARASEALDIVQFRCLQAIRNQAPKSPCWREPRVSGDLDRATLQRLWLAEKVDAHVHRKVWRTDLWQRAVAAMPPGLREARILRTEDILLYGFALLHMTGKYRYIPTVGEIRHLGWADNSLSTAYQTQEQRKLQRSMVANWTLEVFGKAMYGPDL
jgi:glycosyltransferase involved in cell wall biosynthesis